MPNDLDPFDAIQQTNAATQEAAAAPRDVFTEINGQADPLRATAYLGSKMAPERAAKVIALRDRTGLPADLVDRNLDEVEQQAKSADFNPDQYRKTSPKVAAWLAEQPEHYAIASDDLPRLAALERFVGESPEYAWDKNGAVLGAMQGNNRTYYRSTADLLREMQRQNNLAVVDDVQRRMRAESAKDRSPFAAGFLTAGGSTLRLAQSVGDALTGQDRASGTSRQVAQIGEASAINDPGFMADVQRGLGGLTADLPLMLAGSALAPLTTLRGIMGASRLGKIGAGVAATAIAVQPLAIREGILTGQEEGWANGLASWGIETAIPAAFGTTGTEKIITTLLARGVAKEAAPSLSRVAGRLLLDAGLEGTEEAVTELAHALHEVGSGINPAALDPDQLWPRLAVAGSVGAIAGGGFNLPGAIASLSSRGTLDRDANRLIQAASGQQILAGVIQAAQESTTAGRSPEAARTLYQSMLNDKVPQVYLDREAWDQHFQSLNQDPRAKAAELMGDGAKAYDEAARTGAPLTLQTGRLAVDVAKDKATGEWITREARLDPGMMNAREAEEAVKALETLPDDPEQKLQQTAQEAAQAVLEDVEQQLTAAGYDGGSARRSATQMAAVFRTMAARWNAGRTADDANRTDARQLFLEWNVGINRPTPEVLAKPTAETADQILAARRAKIADAQLATVDAGRMAAQAADRALAQQSAGEDGFKLIQEATATLEDVGGQMTTGDAMRALGPAFGFRPDANAPMTPEQAKRGNLLAAALRVRGKSLADLIRDAGAAAADPVATTAAGAQAENDPALEKLTADAFQLEALVTAIRAGRGDLAELEQAAALAAEVGPALDTLKLDQARTEAIRSAVEFAQDGQTLNQGKNEAKNLVVMHNLSADNLLHASRLGAIPVPSLAVARTEHPLTGFGEISLLAPPSLLESRGAKTFDADIYSPRYPRVSYKVDSKILRKAWDRMGQASKDMGHILSSELDDNEVQREGLEAFEKSKAAALTFLRETRRPIELPTEKADSNYVERTPELRPFLEGIQAGGFNAAQLMESPEFRAVYDKAIENEIQSYKDAGLETDGIRAQFYTSQDDIRDSILRKMIDEVRLGKSEKVDRYQAGRAIEAAVAPHLDEFKAWVRSNFAPIITAEQISTETASGNIRKLPHNLENVVKILTRKVRDGEGFNYGVGNLRSVIAKQFRSVKAIQQDRDRIITGEQMDAVKKEIDSEFIALAGKFRDDSRWKDSNEFGSLERGIDILKEVAAKGPRALADWLDAPSPEIAQDAVAFLTKLKNLPTEYFETKIGRAVQLNEFTAAVVPDNAPAAALDVLTKNGIALTTYKHGDEASRAQAIQSAGEASKTLFQPKKGGPRGSITFGRKDAKRQTDIRIFEHADLSTVLHESGHMYLELLVDLAGREGAPAEMQADLTAAMSWLGVTDPGKITVDQHEQWARGFEAYLLEGKAPSTELRGVFARFAAWLGAIYKSVKNLRVELTPEVRGVFDRLLATQEEIADASAKIGDDPIFADAKAAGMSDADFATYQKARNESRQMAEDSLRVDAMREITREQTAAWKELEREVGQEVESETNRAQEYVAASILRTGALPGGVPLPPGTPALKLDSADLKRRIENKLGTKDERKAALARMTKMHAVEGGVAVDEAAKLLGFDSGDALINAMLTLRDRVALIKAETAARMRARFGDMLTDGTIAEKAMAALHNDRKADVHLAEVRALATRVGKKVAPIEVLREAARRKIDSMPVKDILPQAFARAESKARRALEKALAKQDFAAAWNAKQLEMLNHEMYRAAIEAKREGEKIAEYAKKFNEKKKREDIGKAGGWEWTVTQPDGSAQVFDNEADARTAAGPGGKFERTSGYLEKIDDLLERYEFRTVTNKALARRQTLRQWADAQMAAGIAVPIPDAILDASKRTNWRQVPISELRAVRDTLALINKLAKHQNTLSKASREAKLSQVAADLMRTLLRTHPKEQARKIGEKPGYLPRFLAHHRKAANVARQMDGDEDGGPFWDALIRPVNEAATAESAMLREAKAKQEAIWGAWEKQARNDGWPPGERRQFDGFEGGLDRLGALMVALNWGNEGNRARLLEGGGGGKMYNDKGDIVNKPLTEAQVGMVLDSLNAADWNLVEGVWDHIDSYWSEIKALEQRVTGVAPEKVAASPFPTKHGVIKGGYFPVMYDGQETGRIDGEATDLAKQLMAQAHGSTQTAHGHAKERTRGQGRRLDLDPAVIGKHLTRVAHDLTHREAVADALRIIMHPNVRATIDSRLGQQTTRQLRQWVADIAAGPPTTDGARFLGFLRRGFSISTMGFRAMTAAIQVTGFANAVSRVGGKNMAAAIGTLFSGRDSANAWRFVNEKSAMMRERLTTQTREINESLGQFQRSRLEKAQAGVAKWAFWGMQRVQSAVDTATWLAAYDKAQSEQRSEEDAIALADQAVIDTQGSGLTKDLSGVQRDAYLQVFTGAYTYGATLFNQVYDQGARVRRNPKDFATWASAFGNTMLVAALPAAMTVIIRGLTRDWWDDKDDEDAFAERAANEFASTMMGTMVGSRELGGIFSGYGYSGPAVVRPFGDALALATQIKQMDADAGLAKAIVSTAGSWMGLPSGQSIATWTGLMEWLEDPSADIRAPVFGPSPNR